MVCFLAMSDPDSLLCAALHALYGGCSLGELVVFTTDVGVLPPPSHDANKTDCVCVRVCACCVMGILPSPFHDANETEVVCVCVCACVCVCVALQVPAPSQWTQRLWPAGQATHTPLWSLGCGPQCLCAWARCEWKRNRNTTQAHTQAVNHYSVCTHEHDVSEKEIEHYAGSEQWIPTLMTEEVSVVPGTKKSSTQCD